MTIDVSDSLVLGEKRSELISLETGNEPGTTEDLLSYPTIKAPFEPLPTSFSIPKRKGKNYNPIHLRKQVCNQHHSILCNYCPVFIRKLHKLRFFHNKNSHSQPGLSQSQPELSTSQPQISKSQRLITGISENSKTSSQHLPIFLHYKIQSAKYPKCGNCVCNYNSNNKLLLNRFLNPQTQNLYKQPHYLRKYQVHTTFGKFQSKIKKNKTKGFVHFHYTPSPPVHFQTKIKTETAANNQTKPYSNPPALAQTKAYLYPPGLHQTKAHTNPPSLNQTKAYTNPPGLNQTKVYTNPPGLNQTKAYFNPSGLPQTKVYLKPPDLNHTKDYSHQPGLSNTKNHPSTSVLGDTKTNSHPVDLAKTKVHSKSLNLFGQSDRYSKTQVFTGLREASIHRFATNIQRYQEIIRKVSH